MEFDNLMFSLLSVGSAALQHKTKSIRLIRGKNSEVNDDEDKPKTWFSIDLRIWQKDGTWTPTGIRIKAGELRKLYEFLINQDGERSFSNNAYYRRTIQLFEDEFEDYSYTYVCLLEKDKVSGIMLNKAEINLLMKISPAILFFIDNFDLEAQVGREILETCVVYCLYLEAKEKLKKHCSGCNQKGKTNEIEILSPVEHSCMRTKQYDLVCEKWFEDIFLCSAQDKEAKNLFAKVLNFFEKSRTTVIDYILDYFSEIKKDLTLKDKVIYALNNVRSDCFQLVSGIHTNNLLKDVPHPASLISQKRKR